MKTYNQTVVPAEKHPYDVALFGRYAYANYGSVLNYFAVHQTLVGFGLKVLTVRDEDQQYTMLDPYIIKHYTISESYSDEDRNRISNIARTLAVGSDNQWRKQHLPDIIKVKTFDFADNSTRKISLATSLGDHTQQEIINTFKKNLECFDFISVREQEGVDFLRDKINVKAVRLFEPVFWQTRNFYEKIINKKKRKQPTKSYVLGIVYENEKETIEFLKSYARERVWIVGQYLDETNKVHNLNSLMKQQY